MQRSDKHVSLHKSRLKVRLASFRIASYEPRRSIIRVDRFAASRANEIREIYNPNLPRPPFSSRDTSSYISDIVETVFTSSRIAERPSQLMRALRVQIDRSKIETGKMREVLYLNSAPSPLPATLMCQGTLQFSGRNYTT